MTRVGFTGVCHRVKLVGNMEQVVDYKAFFWNTLPINHHLQVTWCIYIYQAKSINLG